MSYLTENLGFSLRANLIYGSNIDVSYSEVPTINDLSPFPLTTLTKFGSPNS